MEIATADRSLLKRRSQPYKPGRIQIGPVTSKAAADHNRYQPAQSKYEDKRDLGSGLPGREAFFDP